MPERGGTADLETLTDLLTSVVRTWLTEGRERTLARYELTLESTRRPELRAKTAEYGGSAMASEPERRGHTLVSYLDGLVLHQLTDVGAGRTDLRAACRDPLVMALAP